MQSSPGLRTFHAGYLNALAILYIIHANEYDLVVWLETPPNVNVIDIAPDHLNALQMRDLISYHVDIRVAVWIEYRETGHAQCLRSALNTREGAHSGQKDPFRVVHAHPDLKGVGLRVCLWNNIRHSSRKIKIRERGWRDDGLLPTLDLPKIGQRHFDMHKLR